MLSVGSDVQSMQHGHLLAATRTALAYLRQIKDKLLCVAIDHVMLRYVMLCYPTLLYAMVH